MNMVFLPCKASLGNFALTGLFIFLFIVWANHGDDISIQYSGTPALKGDFVRYFSMDLASLCSYDLILENINLIVYHHVIRIN